MKVTILETNCGEKVINMTLDEVLKESKKEKAFYKLFWGKNISYDWKDYKSENDRLFLTDEIKVYSYRECDLEELVLR